MTKYAKIFNLVGFLLIVVGIGSTSRDLQSPPACTVPSPISRWSIQSSTVSAKLLWQRGEQIQRQTAFAGSSNSAIAASTKGFVFWQDGAGSTTACYPRLIAFNSQTGEEQWQVPAPDYFTIFKRVVSVSDGYVVMLDQSAIKYDYDGHKIWQNETFPSRATDTISEVDDKLYVPSYDTVYQLSSRTGDTMQIIPVHYPIAYFDKYAVVAAENPVQEGPKFNVIDLEKGSDKLPALDLTDINALQKATAIEWPSTNRFGNILIFYYWLNIGPTHIDAYDLTSGKALWKSTQEFYGVPILVNNKVIFYDAEGLKILDAASGNAVGAVKLSRSVNGTLDKIQPTHVWLSGSGDLLFINYLDTREIVTLELDF